MASIDQLPSGLWHARVRRKGYPAQRRSFARKEDAEAWARKVEGEQERGVWRDRAPLDCMTLGHLLDRYETEVLQGMKSGPVAKYHAARFREDLGHLALTSLTGAALAEWRDARLRCVASATVNRELSTLGGVLTWARKDLGLPIEHVVSAIRRPVQGRARDRRLEPGEETRLLEALGDRAGDVQGAKRAGAYRVGTRNPWMRPLVQFAIETAARRGELLKLAWANVNIEKRTATLRDTKDPKGRIRERTVPLSSRAVAILAALPRGEDARVFPTSAKAAQKAWERACARAGIVGLHFHDLRHEAASRLGEKLSNVLELAAVTGHMDLRSLKRYYHPRAEDLAKKLG